MGNYNVNTQMIAQIMSQVSGLQASVTGIAEHMQANHILYMNQFRIIHQNVHRINQHPVRVLERQHVANNPNGPPPNRTLDGPGALVLGTPKNVYNLWKEWNEGLGGMKAAKDFTQAERGGVNKAKFNLRKPTYLLLQSLVLSGLHWRVACDRVYTVYGQGKSLTNILRMVKKDVRERRLHPLLRVGTGDPNT